jgi:ubiquinone/menaquinone biosynthesis C-methylase UbiE
MTPALPDAWPDELNYRRPGPLWMFVRKALLRRDLGRVALPEGLPLNVALPQYLLLEFHNLPNGNYSKGVTNGYAKGFDMAMMGEMRRARHHLARAFQGLARVLDVGCGAGNSTVALQREGVGEVIGLDASPYMLWHARQRNPGPTYVQGLAENTLMESASFDGISACYLFHELPKRASDQALAEFRRVLKPGGRLAVLEPSEEQLAESYAQLFIRYGWRGPYFKLLAQFVNEPFVRGWHARDVRGWLKDGGFVLRDERAMFPSRLYIAERV